MYPVIVLLNVLGQLLMFLSDLAVLLFSAVLTYRPRYDTIRDAILTCARKPTRVSFIYRTEPTTKNCKTEKLKSKNRHARSNSKSLGNHVASPEGEKRGCSGNDLQKRKALSLE